MNTLLGIQPVELSPIVLALIALIPTLVTLLFNYFRNKSKENKDKQRTGLSTWSTETQVNRDILSRLGAIKTKLGAERVCLFVNHNGVADGFGNHLKKFSLHSVTKDSHIPLETQSLVNLSCSVYNEFFDALLKDGKIEIMDTDKSRNNMATMYKEQGLLSIHAYPIIFDNVFWGFISATNQENMPSIAKVDHEGIRANIELIIKAIKSLDNGNKRKK